MSDVFLVKSDREGKSRGREKGSSSISILCTFLQSYTNFPKRKVRSDARRTLLCCGGKSEGGGKAAV